MFKIFTNLRLLRLLKLMLLSVYFTPISKKLIVVTGWSSKHSLLAPINHFEIRESIDDGSATRVLSRLGCSDILLLVKKFVLLSLLLDRYLSTCRLQD